MKAKKTETEARIKTRYWDAGEDYARERDNAALAVAPENARLLDCGYIVAVGETVPIEEPQWKRTQYAAQVGGGEVTTTPDNAMMFSTYADALKWAVENCEISQLDFPPRGYERPRFPRVCYLRTFAEVKPL